MEEIWQAAFLRRLGGAHQDSAAAASLISIK
jgi:hypothetical protein